MKVMKNKPDLYNMKREIKKNNWKKEKQKNLIRKQKSIHVSKILKNAGYFVYMDAMHYKLKI